MPHNSSATSQTIPKLVSIIIPAYNADRFIESTLDGIGKQSYANWEVIIVEDGTDGETRSIVERFQRRYPYNHVVYVRNETNLGVSRTRNVAIDRARGEYIAFLDADDIWLAGHLMQTVSALNSENADIAYSTAIMFEDGTDLLLGNWGPTRDDLNNFRSALFSRNFITPSATVMRRSVVNDIGLLDPGSAPCEDFDYWLRAAAAGKKFAYVGGCHCLYRKSHQESATRGTCRMTEAFARVLTRHLPLHGPPTRHRRNGVARALFGAGWCHASLSSTHDPTADPNKAPVLIMAAWKLRRYRIDYWLRAFVLKQLLNWRAESLRQRYCRMFAPRHFMRLGYF